MDVYEACVVGIGGIGSSVFQQFALRNCKVLGLDRFGVAHTQGSSHGQTRIFRHAYFENANYTPLLLESSRRWVDIEKATNQNLLCSIGLVEIGAEDGVVVPGVLSSSKRFSLPVEELSPREIEKRWQVFHVPESLVGVYEPHAGYLLVEECIKTFINLATDLGADLRTGVEVQGFELGPTNRIITSAGDFYAEKLIVAGGPWSNTLLADLDLHLEVRRKSTFWFPTTDSQYRAEGGTPAFLYELPKGVFYGIPQHDEKGMKLAEHSGGEVVPDPATVDRDVHAVDLDRVEEFARKHLPKLEGPYREHSVCMYTMSSDGHFILDRHPEHENVLFIAGMSGHGFKFAPVLGKALADLALDGSTDLPVDFLSLERFQEG